MEPRFAIHPFALSRMQYLYGNREDHRYPLKMISKKSISDRRRAYDFKSQTKPTAMQVYEIAGIEFTMTSDLQKATEGKILYYFNKTREFKLDDLEERLGKDACEQVPDASDAPQ